MESINHFTRLTAAFLGLTILVLGIAAIWLIRMRKKSLKTKKAETEERGLFSQTDELVPIDEIGPGFKWWEEIYCGTKMRWQRLLHKADWGKSKGQK